MLVMAVLAILLLVGVLALVARSRRRRSSMAESVTSFARTESDNSPAGMYEQGVDFRRGVHVEQDFQTARSLFRRAAQLHHAAAQFEYGDMLMRGLGGERDIVNGLRWIRHAARHACSEARLFMGKYFLEPQTSNPQLAEKYLLQVAETGQPEAQTMLGLLYRNPSSPLYNSNLAAEWLSRAVLQRYPPAFLPLSEQYENGSGLPRDVRRADELLLQAADFGDAKAQLKLARYYLSGAYGHTFPADYRAALAWFMRAAANGVAEAEYEVGMRYEMNEGVAAPDMVRAADSYLKAADKGYMPAQYRIGLVYLYGQGVNQNLREARRWLAAAAAQGHADAAKRLQRMPVQGQSDIMRLDAGPDETNNDVEWKD